VDAEGNAGEDMCCDWEGDEEGFEGEGLVVGAGEEEVGF
jgi:hypothetical protein